MTEDVRPPCNRDYRHVTTDPDLVKLLGMTLLKDVAPILYKAVQEAGEAGLTIRSFAVRHKELDVAGWMEVGDVLWRRGKVRMDGWREVPDPGKGLPWHPIQEALYKPVRTEE